MSTTITRTLSWMVYCPRCLAAAAEHVQYGLPSSADHITCPACEKPFVVESRVDGNAMPLCMTRPVAIRAPELLQDNAPLPQS